MDFCRADAEIRHRMSLFERLKYLHCGRQICYLAVKDDLGNVIEKALPQKKWCEHCKSLPWESLDYTDAKWERRAAKTRMKRAYKKLAGVDPGKGGPQS